jgi:uncharacterized membrane protein
MGRASRKRKHLPTQPSQPQPPSRGTLVHASFSGPLPPPEALDRYNQIVPGLAERIVAMAESQSQHRQALERKVIDSNIRNERLGQVFAFFIAMTVVVGSLILLWHGRNLEGLTGILGTLVSLAGVFVYGRWSKRKELAEKRQLVSG